MIYLYALKHGIHLLLGFVLMIMLRLKASIKYMYLMGDIARVNGYVVIVLSRTQTYAVNKLI